MAFDIVLLFSAGASATWLSAVHCASSTTRQQQALSQLLQLRQQSPPQALLKALLLGKQAAYASGSSSSSIRLPGGSGSTTGGLYPTVGAGASGQTNNMMFDYGEFKAADVVGWLREVTAAADWSCWALDQG
jgi:hypothetical protein